MCVYELNMVLNTPQVLICYKAPANKTKPTVLCRS